MATFFVLLQRIIESHPPYLKKPARSTPVSFDQRDRHTPARLPRSNEATGRVTKGQAAQPAYAGLANEVVPILAIKNSQGACNDSHPRNLIKRSIFDHVLQPITHYP